MHTFTFKFDWNLKDSFEKVHAGPSCTIKLFNLQLTSWTHRQKLKNSNGNHLTAAIPAMDPFTVLLRGAE